jgi:hypothetical protein
MWLTSYSIPTKAHIYPGLPHGFRRWPELAATQHFDRSTTEAINWALSKEGNNIKIGEEWHVYGADETKRSNWEC